MRQGADRGRRVSERVKMKRREKKRERWRGERERKRRGEGKRNLCASTNCITPYNVNHVKYILQP